MTIYKILHIPTGLFLNPDNRILSRRVKTLFEEPTPIEFYYHPNEPTKLRKAQIDDFKIKKIVLEVRDID